MASPRASTGFDTTFWSMIQAVVELAIGTSP
jgi:hypothetical protein